MVDPPNLDVLHAALIARKIATIHELETIYDVVDVLDMFEALTWHDALEAAAYGKTGK